MFSVGFNQSGKNKKLHLICTSLLENNVPVNQIYILR